MLTKEQETKILSKIEKLINEAGADSYIGIAFEGCVQDARTNIENDWGCSEKQRADLAEERLEQAKQMIGELKKEVEVNENAAADLREKLAEVQRKQLSGNDRKMVFDLISDEYRRVLDEGMNAREQVIANCENPDGEAFRKAVATMKRAERRSEELKALRERIKAQG